MRENDPLHRFERAVLKRRLVKATIADNVALIDGKPPGGERPGRRSEGGGRWRWAAAVVLVPLVGVFLFLARPRAHAGLDTVTTVHLATTTTAAPLDSVTGPEAATVQRGIVPPPSRDGAPPLERSRPEPSWFHGAPERIDPSIFPLEVHHIVLDPGHGGEDAGTLNRGLTEKELTLDIARRLRARLEHAGFRVSMTREGDRTVVLRERSDYANEIGADLFVSIHINSIYTQVRGIETYFLGTTDDPKLNALARRENRHSGYSLADQDSLIRSVILSAQHDRSHDLARRVHRSLYQSLRPVNPALRDRGVKTAPFVVLVGTEMPAILAEVSTLSNSEEAELLARPLYREHIAEALFAGIRRYADDVNASEEEETGP